MKKRKKVKEKEETALRQAKFLSGSKSESVVVDVPVLKRLIKLAEKGMRHG